LWYVNTDTDLPDLSEMKSSQMKKELESYGVSTKSLFDKSEFEKALREERLKQVPQIIKDRTSFQTEHASAKEEGRKTTWREPKTERKKRWMEWEKTSSQSTPEETRAEKYDNAFQFGIDMKLSELKQELKDRGISTSAFFEKVELAKAYAEAVADNVSKKARTKNAGADYRGASRNSRKDEAFDPSYRDVHVEPFRAALTINPGDTVIDITEMVKGTTVTDGVWQ
jgi:predicted HTH domain antitoxin